MLRAHALRANKGFAVVGGSEPELEDGRRPLLGPPGTGDGEAVRRPLSYGTRADDDLRWQENQSEGQETPWTERASCALRLLPSG